MIKNSDFQVFVAIVDRRDADLFSTLENNHDDRELVWGFRKNDLGVWIKINPGDVVCMVLEDTVRISMCGSVRKTYIDSGFPKNWGLDVRTLQMTHVVYFTRLQKFTKMLDNVQEYIIQNNMNLPGIYKVPKKYIGQIKEEELRVGDKLVIKKPVDLDGPPARIKSNVVRFIRDTQKSRLLKNVYGNRCQVCDYRLEIGTNTYYSEVHHIRPLNEGGNDDFNNMIVLCPTHHAEFDYGVICINEDITHVVDKNSNRVGTITVNVDHDISMENIKYNLKKVCTR